MAGTVDEAVFSPLRSALRVALVYLVFGVLWITLSDYVVAWFVTDVHAMTHVQNLKGWAYIVATAALLYGLVAADARALHATARQLAATRQRYERMFSAAHSLVISLSSELRIVEWNQAAAELLGWRIDLMRGREFPESAVPPDWQKELRRRLEALLAGIAFEPWECPVVDAHGETRPVSWRAYGIASVDQRGQEIVVIGRDATEIRRLEAQLQTAQKLEAIGLLAAGVAHDFNNVLTAMLGHIELVRESLDPTRPDVAAATADVDQLENAARRAAILTRRLLALTRRRPTPAGCCDLNQLVPELRNMLQRLLPENINLQAHMIDRLWPVRADAAQVEQIVLNLAVNARDAMPSGGQLSVELRNVEVDRQQAAVIADALPGPHVRLCVRDTGCGMEPAVRARIGEPFFTTKGAGKGTGLGLTSVFSVLHQVGGHLSVESAPGVGTTFEVYLPAEPTAVAPAPAAAPPARLQGNESVLVCEDDRAVRMIVARMLEEHGYTVVAIENPQVALELVRRDHPPIDLLITDLSLPGMTGPELARAVAREYAPGLRILFISGYSADSALTPEERDPTRTLLQKPFTPQDLLRRVRQVLDSPVAARV